MAQIKFAPVIRVSTEGQEKRGESLKTQEAQIRQYVASIPDGIIPEYCWKYKGQESATPGQERALFDQLLQDAAKGLFDAIICCDASRWSRDNAKSKAGLEILKANGIRFFIGTMEYDLYDPAQNLFLGMSAEIGEFQARQQALKSIQNRIKRAQRGIPSVGRLPYGRIYNKKTGEWSIDPEKQALIKQAVDRYIKGEKLEDIAKTVGTHKSFLWKIFKYHLGTEWQLSFVNKKVNVNEQVIIKVPALIDDSKILKAVEERNRSNKLSVRGHRKYSYLLSGFIFCKRCGSKIQGSTNRHGRFRRYYYHFRYRNENCGFNRMIPATELENSVLIKLIQTFGDPKMMEEALLKATPDAGKKTDLEKEAKRLNDNLKKIYAKKSTIIDLAIDKIITKEETREKMEKLHSEEQAINERLQVIDAELKSYPDPKKIKQLSSFAVKMSSHLSKNPKQLFKKSDEWKRKLIEKAFSGTDKSGQRLGVYVDITDTKGQFTFEIHGLFNSTVETIPMTDDQIIEIFNLDPDNDLYDNVNSIRSNILGIGGSDVSGDERSSLNS